jgi:hypothetical protein
MKRKIYIPTGNRVLFRAPERLTSSAGDTKIGDIVLPEGAAERIMQAQSSPYIEVKVLSCGPDCQIVKPGDVVVVNRNHIGSMDFPDAKGIAILSETELHAVVREADDA